jgi:hypothetical protein
MKLLLKFKAITIRERYIIKPKLLNSGCVLCCGKAIADAKSR